MAKLVTLRCPSCGANVRFAQGAQAFTCDHCGSVSILEGGGQSLPVSYKASCPDWIRVGDYEIRLHEILEETKDEQRVVYINVEFGNPRSASPLSCRRNQWLLFDMENYSYEAESSSKPLYEDRSRPFFGGERFLNRNMQARGWLAFKVPAAAQLKRLQFFTGYLSTKTVDILLDGPRLG